MRKSRAFDDDGNYRPLANKLLDDLIIGVEKVIVSNWKANKKNITRKEFKEIYSEAMFLVGLGKTVVKNS